MRVFQERSARQSLMMASFLSVDIPLQSLHLLFNTSFAIVSQVGVLTCSFSFAIRADHLRSCRSIHMSIVSKSTSAPRSSSHSPVSCLAVFFFAPKGTAGRPVAHRKGKGWRGGFLLAAMEQYLKLELSKNFRVIRDLCVSPLRPSFNCWGS